MALKTEEGGQELRNAKVLRKLRMTHSQKPTRKQEP